MSLDLDGVSAGYGAGDVLHEVSLNVHEGEIVVILGANGAGKTTLMRTISGTIARRGRIAFEGVDISSFAPDRIVRLGVAQVPQGRGTLVDLTVEENLRAGALSHEGRSTVKADIERWFGVYPSLAERSRQKAGLLSGRRAADAGHFASHDESPEAALVRRAQPGPVPKAYAGTFRFTQIDQ